MAPPGTVPMMTRMIPLCASAADGTARAARESASQTMPRRLICETLLRGKSSRADQLAAYARRSCSAHEKVRLHRALTFDVQWPARLKLKVVAKQVICFSRDVNTAGSAETFHTARGIHRVAPDIVDEFVRANHAGNDRPNMNPNPDFQIDAQTGAHALYDVQHLDRECGHSVRVVRQRLGQPAGDHIGVADGLDFFEPLLLDGDVEALEYGGQYFQDAIRREAGRQRSKSDEIREQDGRIVKPICDDGFTGSHARHDVLRQDVEQQGFRAQLLRAQLLEMLLLAVAQPFLFQTRVDFWAQQNRVERLRQIVFRSRLDAPYRAVELIESGDHDDRNMPRAGARLKPAQDLKAAHAWHHQIEQDQVEILGRQEIERACTTLDSDDLMAFAREASLKKIAIGGDIVDDKNPACELAPALALPHINRRDRAQQSGDNLDRLFLFIREGRRRAWFDPHVDLLQQLIRRFPDFVEIRQQLHLPAIPHVLDQHFAIAFDGIERCT